MALETHKGLHSALFFPVPGRLVTPPKSTAGATLGVIIAPVRAPLYLTKSLAQEVPGGHLKYLLSARSLLSFPGGLYSWSPSWLDPSRLLAYWGIMQALVFGFSPRCSHALPPWLMPLLPLPTVKVMPQLHAQTSHPD